MLVGQATDWFSGGLGRANEVPWFSGAAGRSGDKQTDGLDNGWIVFHCPGHEDVVTCVTLHSRAGRAGGFYDSLFDGRVTCASELGAQAPHWNPLQSIGRRRKESHWACEEGHCETNSWCEWT